jgi:hypothetical protein
LLDIPIPGSWRIGSAFGGGNAAWGEVFATAQSDVSATEILATYEAALTRLGWKVRTRDSLPGFALAVFDSLAGSARRGVLTITEDVVSRSSKTLVFRFEKVAVEAVP